jgi:hypothetical protein
MMIRNFQIRVTTCNQAAHHIKGRKTEEKGHRHGRDRGHLWEISRRYLYNAESKKDENEGAC